MLAHLRKYTFAERTELEDRLRAIVRDWEAHWEPIHVRPGRPKEMQRWAGEYALLLARTAQALDEEMSRRIEKHRAERPADKPHGPENLAYVKRFATPKFILGREYRLFEPDKRSAILLLLLGTQQQQIRLQLLKRRTALFTLSL